MLNDANRRKFDILMVWAIDRLGRSLIDLTGTIEHLEAAGVDLYLDQQNIDITTPMGKLLFQITGAFAEFEHTGDNWSGRGRMASWLKQKRTAVRTSRNIAFPAK
jgi:hypothetical protein